METCVFIKENGERCGTPNNLSPAGFCLWHDPERRESADAARKRGIRRANEAKKLRRKTPLHNGKAASWRTVLPSDAPEPPKTLDDCVEWLSWLSVAVVTGEVDARTAKEAVSAVKALQAAVQTRDLERELEHALRQLAELRRLKAV